MKKQYTNVIQLNILLLLILFIACNSNSEAETKADGLKDIAEYPIGSAINLKYLFSDSMLLELQIENFNSVTARNKMKMRSILPADGRYYWGVVDSLVMFSLEHNQRLFGHTLIWHSSTPKWVEERAKGDSAWLNNFMREYIQTYVGRYKGKVHGWDVVNEGMNTIGGDFRPTIWYNELGRIYSKSF